MSDEVDPAAPRSARPTMTQVAAVCGVSTGAVSLALNRSLEASRLREETYGKIRRVAAEMGYRADWRGRALAKGRIHSIGLLSARMTPHVTDVYEQMYDVIAETLGARGYHMHFIPALGEPNAWREIIEDQRVEGCLIVPPMPFDLPAMLRNLRMPAVLMNVQSDESLPQFLPDDAGGTRMLMEHLWGLGHRRIGFAMSPATHSHHSVGARRDAFRAFAAERGVADECPVVELDPAALAGNVKRGATRVTAIVSYKGSYAIELLHMLWRAGLVVPRDLSLATFDDSWVMSYLHPPMTSVTIPMNEIARQASNLLIDALERPAADQARATTLLPETLVVRESTAAVPVGQ